MIDINDLLKKHNIQLALEEVVNHPEIIGANKDFLKDKSKQHRDQLIQGEYLLFLSQVLGEISSQILKNAQWSYETPDWFDHRHHLINKMESKNSWTESISLILRLLPVGGKILNLCAGDAFFDSYFFENISSSIDCYDINDKDEYKNFVIKKNIKDSHKINYYYEDILTSKFNSNYYDIVIMRSAIEHFSEKNQVILFEKIKNTLKDTGYFCGDTPANPNKMNKKEHTAHENEWMDESECKNLLINNGFNDVNVYTLHCPIDKRDTIFWYCKK